MSNKNLLKITIPDAFNNKILNIGDQVYILFNPCGNELGYRYYLATILSIEVLGDWEKTEEQVDNVQIINTEDNIVLAKHLRIRFEYYLNNVRQWVSLVMWKDFNRVYLLEEKEELDKDIEKLNEILNLKRKYKQMLQNQINDMLQNWNYRGIIKI